MAQSKLKLTQIKSLIGRTTRQKNSVRGLGLRRMHHTVEVEDTPANCGMINRVRDMIRVEEA